MPRSPSGHDANEMTGRRPHRRASSAPKGHIDPRALTVMLPEILEMSKRLSVKVKRTPENNPYRIAVHPANATPPNAAMAMDNGLVANNDWAAAAWLNGIGAEGLLFLGYSYLAELAQRPEYRTISETFADEATRKWIDFEITGDENENARRRRRDPVGESERLADPDDRKKRIAQAGKTDKVKALKDDQERLEVRSRFYSLLRDDGFFGRSHLYLNFGEDIGDNPKELAIPIGDGRDKTSQRKIGRGSFREIKTIEAQWVYPLAYNAINPLADGWYAPRRWYVMGTEIDGTRLLPFIGHPVPDLLKPAYSFGGLSLSQLAKPYVDIWLTTSRNIAELVHSFSVMVLMTDMSTILQPGNAAGLLSRAMLFNQLRDNQGLMIVNKDSEDFKNVQASLSGLHELQAQAQEHVASSVRLPLIKYTGLQPSGLNASSEGEIRVHYDNIAAYQQRLVRPNLTRVVNFEQLSLFGEIDPEITIKFEPLWEESAKEKGERQKAEAETRQIYVDFGAFSPAEIRKVAIDDAELPFTQCEPGDLPDLGSEEEEGLEPRGGNPKLVAEEVGDEASR